MSTDRTKAYSTLSATSMRRQADVTARNRNAQGKMNLGGGQVPYELNYTIRLARIDSSSFPYDWTEVVYENDTDWTIQERAGGLTGDSTRNILFPFSETDTYSVGDIVAFIPRLDVPGTFLGLVSGNSGGGSWVIPIDEVSVTAPSACADYPSAVGISCFTSYFYCAVLSYDPYCGSFSISGCAYLSEVNGKTPEIGVRYRGYLAGLPPDVVTGATAPVGMPCTPADNAPLYLVDIGDVVRTIFITAELDYCPSADYDPAYKWYTGYSAKFTDCGWMQIESTVAIFNVTGCPLPLDGTPFEGQWQDTIKSSDIGGSDTKCISVYSTRYKKEPLAGVCDLLINAGAIDVYKWLPTDNCGTVECIKAYTINCGTCTGGGGGGGGGSVTSCCPDRTLPATLYVVLPGVSSPAPIIYDGSQYWKSAGGFTLPCGLSVQFQMDKATCLLEWSCNGINWLPLNVPLSSAASCGPPFTAGPFDSMNIGAGESAGCEIPNDCPTYNGIMVVEL